MKGMIDNKCFSSIEEYIDGEQKTTINLNQCSKNEKCSQTSWDPSIDICSDNICKSFSGEKCQSDADCYTQACDHIIFVRIKNVQMKSTC